MLFHKPLVISWATASNDNTDQSNQTKDLTKHSIKSGKRSIIILSKRRPYNMERHIDRPESVGGD